MSGEIINSNSTPQGGENSEHEETIIETTQENTSDELFEELDDDFDEFFYLHHGLLLHMISYSEPYQYIVYKNNKPIAFVYSKLHDFCEVGDATIFDTENFALDNMTEKIVENLSERLQRDILQEEKEKIEDLLKYYDKIREEKRKNSKYLEAAKFYEKCKDKTYEGRMAKLINRHIAKVGEDKIGELDTTYTLGIALSPEKIQQIEKRLQNKKNKKSE